MIFFKKILSLFAVSATAVDPAVEKLLNNLIGTLQIDDENLRLEAMLQVVHKSLTFTDPNGVVDLDRSIKEFSYKKATQAANQFSVPVHISSVQKGVEQTIGVGDLAERGRVDKYFIKRNSGVQGTPAPVHVFFPQSGTSPKVVNFGSI